ncbi:unnamed protein product [Macrosiphum euphorbiae]|uniref:Uncharacterized protein n=1 Tax=Macrosiphum euphorbiae TaxID=13131 RepID=A0AAV0XAL8_9HEMI|nr:unnamed protein product [Macrosiphum euphorbiae]
MFRNGLGLMTGCASGFLVPKSHPSAGHSVWDATAASSMYRRSSAAACTPCRMAVRVFRRNWTRFPVPVDDDEHQTWSWPHSFVVIVLMLVVLNVVIGWVT